MLGILTTVFLFRDIGIDSTECRAGLPMMFVPTIAKPLQMARSVFRQSIDSLHLCQHGASSGEPVITMFKSIVNTVVFWHSCPEPTMFDYNLPDPYFRIPMNHVSIDYFEN